MRIFNIIILFSLLFVTACEDLDQSPPNIASSNSLTDFTGVLNAAYFYQHGSVTPMAVMGDFRADNAFMEEEPFPSFDRFNGDLVDMEDQFFGPFYTALYRSILSANNVIENSTDATQVGEARFLRGLSYFKLVRAFGDVTVNLSASPSTTDPSIFTRQPASDVYNRIIIPDLQDAISALGTESVNGRASRLAAQGMLGKVFMQMGDFSSAQAELAAVVNGAESAGFSLQENFSDIFGVDNDLNSEIIYSTQISSSIVDEYGFSEFWSWSGGLDRKSLLPLDEDLIAAFDASEAGGETDLRREVTINEDIMASPKFPQTGGPDHDWIELRLADAILLYAEALNENGDATGALAQLNRIRTRAGLSNSTASSQSEVRTAIANERRLELAFEGQRWFDLVRTGTVSAELGETVDSRYFLFPVPISEILASSGAITQNDGY